MAIKSYLFKSTKENILKLDRKDNIPQKFEGIESSGIDPTTLTQLESLLTGEDYYNICEKGDYSIIHRFEEESRPVFISSSSRLIDCLKNLPDDKKHEVLEKMCNTFEMSLYGWTPQKAEYIIDWLLSTCHENLCPKEEFILFVDLENKETIKIS